MTTMEEVSRYELMSPKLLLMAMYPLAGIIIGVVVLLSFGDHIRGGGPFDFAFAVSDPATLTNVFSVIGLFHAGIAFILTNLSARLINQIRTRALERGIQLNTLLNTLPDSPAPLSTWMKGFGLLLMLVPVLSTTYGAAAGVLYKQGFTLSTIQDSLTTEYPIQYITGCSPGGDMKCKPNRVTLYGQALERVFGGGAYSTGIQVLGPDHRRVVIAAIPVMTPRDPGTVSGEVLVLVSDYENADPRTKFTAGSYVDVVDSSYPEFGFTNVTTVAGSEMRWMVSFSGMKVIGDAKWCLSRCHWQFGQNRTLKLDGCNFDNSTSSKCYQADYKSVNGLYWGQDYSRTFAIDYSDRLEGGPGGKRLLDAGYIFPALYSVQALGPYGSRWPISDISQKNESRLGDAVFKESLPFNVVFNHPAIQSNKYLGVYIMMVVVTMLMLVYCGYVDKRVWATVWAPLYIAVLGQDDITAIKNEVDSGLKPVQRKELRGRYLREDAVKLLPESTQSAGIHQW